MKARHIATGLSTEKAAKMADGQMSCKDCPYRICSDTMMKHCSEVFRKGFIQGAKFQKRKYKEKESKK